jgi:hypothetical protein
MDATMLPPRRHAAAELCADARHYFATPPDDYSPSFLSHFFLTFSLLAHYCH